MKIAKKLRASLTAATAAMSMASIASTTAMAAASGFGSVTVSDAAPDAGKMMGSVIGILLTITRFVGVALIVYGVYETVMSFMQNQPEAKTKGITMALCGVVCVSLKSILVALGVVTG